VASAFRILLVASAVWAAAALAWQAASARAKTRKDPAAPAGSPGAGVLYAFTGAMLPARKESASKHPVSFAAGLLLHAGVFTALIAILVSAAFPSRLGVIRLPAMAVISAGFAACLGLLFRRVTQRGVRAISIPDDYVAGVMIALFLMATLAFLADALAAGALWMFTSVLLFYLPLGKLRHSVFFFLARRDLGAKLGLRGVYPSHAGKDPSHGG
jgi:nitrate reductase gamma subunit